MYPQPSEECLAQRNHLVNVSDDLVFFHSTSNHWELRHVTKTLPGASRPMQSPGILPP